MQTRITRWRNLLDPNGTEQAITWLDLFGEFSRIEPFRGDKEHPGWSPATFDPCQRGLENVQQVFAICLDHDKGETIAAALTLWREHFGLLHTTRKHRADAPRFRVILPFSRPVSPFEFEALWLRINAHAGGKLDPSPKDPSRFWFTPGVADGAEFEAHRLAGAMMINPDRWLKKPAPAAPRPEPEIRRPAPTDERRAIEKRAIAYIAKMPEAISGSGGHMATWQVAVMLAKGFGLDEQTTFSILWTHYNPRCSPEWTEKELRHKAKQAQKARVPDGFKLEDDRDWEPRRVRIQEPPPPDPDPDYEPSDPYAAAESDEAPEDDHDAYEPPPPADEKRDPAAKPQRPATERHGLISMLGLMQQVVSELNKPRPRRGALTGHPELDIAIGGYRRGNVTVFGAKRGFGKTSYGNMVVNLAVPAHNVIVFATEDAAEMYGKRFLALRAGLNAMLLRDYRVNREDWPRITQALKEAPVNPFFVRVDGRPVEWCAQVIKEVDEQLRDETGEGLHLVAFDYLQKGKTQKRLQDRRNEVTYVTATLVDATKRANAAGLFFSQLKRSERLEPELEDLKESGDIEDMIEHAILGWKEEATKTHAARRLVKVAKNKDGTEASEIASIELPWSLKTANFVPSWEPQDELGDVPPEDRRYGD